MFKFNPILILASLGLIVTSCGSSLFEEPEDEAKMGEPTLITLDISEASQWKWISDGTDGGYRSFQGEPVTGCDGNLTRLRWAAHSSGSSGSECSMSFVASGEVTVVPDPDGKVRVSLPKVIGRCTTVYLWLDDPECNLYQFNPVKGKVYVKPEEWKPIGEKTQALAGWIHTKDSEWPAEVKLENPFGCLTIPSCPDSLKSKYDSEFSVKVFTSVSLGTKKVDESKYVIMKVPAVSSSGIVHRNLMLTPGKMFYTGFVCDPGVVNYWVLDRGCVTEGTPKIWQPKH